PLRERLQSTRDHLHSRGRRAAVSSGRARLPPSLEHGSAERLPCQAGLLPPCDITYGVCARSCIRTALGSLAALGRPPFAPPCVSTTRAWLGRAACGRGIAAG